MKTRFFAFAALALTLAACNNDSENLNDGPVAAQFIADITPATRVNQDGTDWTDGDCIGITGAGFINIPGPTATASASPAQASPTCPTRERTVSS